MRAAPQWPALDVVRKNDIIWFIWDLRTQCLDGRTEEKIETATIMKQEGFDPAVIAKITRLPLSEIEQLN
jgi:hypothetical protein